MNLITPKYVKTPIINGAPDVKLKGDEMHIENYLVFTAPELSTYYQIIEGMCPMDDTLYSVKLEGRFVQSIFKPGERLTVKNRQLQGK